MKNRSGMPNISEIRAKMNAEKILLERHSILVRYGRNKRKSMKTPMFAAIAQVRPRWSRRYQITGGIIRIAAKRGKYRMIKPAISKAPKA